MRKCHPLNHWQKNSLFPRKGFIVTPLSSYIIKIQEVQRN